MKHILFTLKGCPYGLLDDEAHIRNVLANAAQLSESTLLNVSTHKFNPCGVTAIALLAESHISIHTWPENGLAVCDVLHVVNTQTLDLVQHTCMKLWVPQIWCLKSLRDLWNEHLCN